MLLSYSLHEMSSSPILFLEHRRNWFKIGLILKHSEWFQRAETGFVAVKELQTTIIAIKRRAYNKASISLKDGRKEPNVPLCYVHCIEQLYTRQHGCPIAL